MSETYTLYKLIVLYMLDKVDFPLTTSQISNLFWKKNTQLILSFRKHSLKWNIPDCSAWKRHTTVLCII